MKIPEKVKIGGQTFSVTWKTLGNSSDTSTGACQWGMNRIWLDSGFPRSVQESTFLHEIIEAIDGLFELELSHPTIKALEHALYEVLTDNDLLKE